METAGTSPWTGKQKVDRFRPPTSGLDPHGACRSRPVARPGCSRIGVGQRNPDWLRWLKLGYLKSCRIEQGAPIDGLGGNCCLIHLRRNRLEIDQTSPRIEFEVD